MNDGGDQVTSFICLSLLRIGPVLKPVSEHRQSYNSKDLHFTYNDVNLKEDSNPERYATLSIPGSHLLKP